MTPRLNLIALPLVALLAAAAPSHADVVYETNDPFGSPLGINGFDVFSQQSVATRFTPNADFTLDQVGVWLWNNDDSGREPLITITLRRDDAANGESRPGSQIFETWQMNMPPTGVFQPVFFTFNSSAHPPLAADERYWVVAQSPVPAGGDPVWAWAANDSGVTTTTDSQTGLWYPAPDQGAVAALTVLGTPSSTGTPGDVDGDGDVDLSDLASLLSAFGSCSGEGSYNAAADFDGSGCIELADLAVLLANFGT